VRVNKNTIPVDIRYLKQLEARLTAVEKLVEKWREQRKEWDTVASTQASARRYVYGDCAAQLEEALLAHAGQTPANQEERSQQRDDDRQSF